MRPQPDLRSERPARRASPKTLLRIHRPRLLVVEDDLSMWELVERAALESNPEMQVHWAADAEAARLAMEHYDFDAVIADFMLGDSSNGWSILALARELQPDARLAMASALPLRPPETGDLDLEVPFLRKPFAFGDCRDFVARLFS